MIVQLKNMSQEQHDFPLFLLSIGCIRTSKILRAVSEFKQTAFDYLVLNPDSAKVTIFDILKSYLEQLNQTLALSQINKNEHTTTTNALKKYFQFLNLNWYVSDEWHQYFASKKITKYLKPKSTLPMKKEKKVFYLNGRKTKDFLNNLVFRDYMEQLKQRNAACFEEHYSCIGYFLRFLRNNGITNLDSLPREYIRKYEQHLESRYLLKEIKKKTAYEKLLKFKKFIKYLYSINLIGYKYDIPIHFKGNKINRDNEYVTNEDRFALIETILRENNRNLQRDLTTTLIFIDLGCRPIEVCNLRMTDVNTTESTLTLYCLKTGQRVLKVAKFVMNQIEKYLEYRKPLPAKSDHLFLLETGDPMNTKAIGGQINSYNKSTFGEARFSAKSLRHTLITNALNDKNDIKKVAEAAGHAHLVSTMHYFYRSIETLLENTLPYNPVEGIDQINES